MCVCMYVCVHVRVRSAVGAQRPRVYVLMREATLSAHMTPSAVDCAVLTSRCAGHPGTAGPLCEQCQVSPGLEGSRCDQCEPT